MDYREFLVHPIAYLEPAKALDGLDAADAERRLPGANHSIAEIVAHIEFWQRWFHDRCEGRDVPPATSAAEGWPAVEPGAWPAIRDRFLDVLPKLAALGEGDNAAKRIEPAIPFPPLAHYTIGDALTHTATHNAHHLGQVIVLRQLMGKWPPPAGSWTW